MHTFTIHLRKGASKQIRAWAYTDDTASGRTYFHKQKDKSDRDSYFASVDIVGIDKEETSEPQSLDSVLKQLRQSPETERSLRQLLGYLEKRKDQVEPRSDG